MREYNKSRVGETFNGGSLVVVDDCVKDGYVKVKCLVCSKDTELFGEAVYRTLLTGLRAGKKPCGCSKNYKWSLLQYAIRIKRKITNESLPIKFIGFGVSNSSLCYTPVRLLCNRLGVEFNVSSISKFLTGRGNLGITRSVAEFVTHYNSINHDSIIWDSGIKNASKNAVCGFYCKTCENEGFESLFQVQLCVLQRGGLPCYCSRTKMNLSGDHIVEMTKRKLYEQDLKYISVLGAVKKGVYWYSTFICELHGVYSVAYGNLTLRGCHCQECSPPLTGYDKTKTGSLYVLEIQTDFDIILGYGITNKLGNRLTTHRKNLNNLGYKILSTRIFEGSGARVLSVENSIKALHVQGLISCEGFRRESISIDRKEEVLKLCTGLKEISLDIPPNL